MLCINYPPGGGGLDGMIERTLQNQSSKLTSLPRVV